MIRKTVFGLALAAASVGLAEANQVRQTLEDVSQCAAIADNAQRLACYDAAAPKVRSSLNIATREDRVTVFGLDLFGSGDDGASGEATRPEDFGNDDMQRKVETVETGGVVTEITAGVADVGRNASGKDVIVLENGQVWRQKEDKNLQFPKDLTGVRVKIRQASLGSYLLTRDGSNRSVQVERVR